MGARGFAGSYDQHCDTPEDVIAIRDVGLLPLPQWRWS
jgi:hypothetical protein